MDTDDEVLFSNSKADMQYACCDATAINKLQPFSLHEDGSRVYCQSCCAMADGTTMSEAISNFKNKKFTHGPQV